MQTEIFKGTFDYLKARLDVIIGGGRVINNVVKLAGGTYLIMHT
jgi:hypothetical protein